MDLSYFLRVSLTVLAGGMECCYSNILEHATDRLGTLMQRRGGHEQQLRSSSLPDSVANAALHGKVVL